MSLTVSQVIQDVQFELDDTGIISNTAPGLVFALRLINKGRRKILEDTLCLNKTVSFSSVDGTYKFALPSDFYMAKSVMFNLNGIDCTVYPVDLDGWQKMNMAASGNSYANYFCDGGYIYLNPVVGSAETVTLNGGINASDTTITVVSTASMPQSGRILVGSEVIFYNDISSTALLYCTRGEEGTTAASHLTGVTGTLRNLLLTYHYFPADVTATSNTLEAPYEKYPDVLTYWICHRVKNRDTDDVQATGSNQQSGGFFQLYQKEIGEMQMGLATNADIQNTIRRIR